MSIRVVDRKMLWGRASDLCAFPGCSEALTTNLDDPESLILGDAGAVIGQEAHIRSGRLDGPRYDPEFPQEKIDSYSNLILLCPTHHTTIDKDQGRAYSVEDIQEMRNQHESTMSAMRSTADESRRLITERLAASVKLWEDKMLVEEWQSLTFSLNFPIPYLDNTFLEAMQECNEWLLAKDWPQTFPATSKAFGRFREVLNVTISHVIKNFEPNDKLIWELDREYKRIPWNAELYERLMAKFQLECTITWCLVIELTQAANLIVRAVREEIEPFYRFEEGILLAREGDGIIQTRILRLEYVDYQWNENFPTIDLKQWRAIIKKKAQERQLTRIFDLNPFELMEIFHSQQTRVDDTQD